MDETPRLLDWDRPVEREPGLRARVQRLRRRGFAALAVVVVAVVVLPVWGLVALANGIDARNDERDRLEQLAVSALPQGARLSTSGRAGSRGFERAWAVGLTSDAAAAALAASAADLPGLGWSELGSAEAAVRAFLSPDRELVLDVTARPCVPTIPLCPAGQVRVEVDVVKGGPGSGSQ